MDRKFFDAIRQGLEQMQVNEAKASGAGPVDKAHYCATHVEHAEHGQGVCISEEHAEPAEDGSIAWYTVQFEGKEPMVVNTAEMKILQAESHMHSKKKKMAEETEEQIEEAMSKEFEKQFADQPKGVEVHMHHPKTNRVTKEKFMGTHNAVKAAAKHISDMQKLGWKVKEKKLIESEEQVDEAMQKADVPAYLRKQKGEKPLTVADVKGPRKDSISSKEGLAKLRNEEVELAEGVKGISSLDDEPVHIHDAKSRTDVEKAIHHHLVTTHGHSKEEASGIIQDMHDAHADEGTRHLDKAIKGSTHKEISKDSYAKQMAKHLHDQHKENMSEEAKTHTVPKTAKEKDLAAIAEPKDKITHADVLVGRGVKKEEMSSKEKMKRGLYNKEDVDTEQYAEIIEKFDDFTVEVKESYTFAEYLNAAKALVVEEDVVSVADAAYRAQDTDFVLEAFTQGEIEDKVAAHRKAGNKVTMPTFGKKSGQPYAEYTVTDKDGQKRKYIHHGSSRKVETLG